jgi:ribosome-associated translation inhibitor RaiA
MRFPDQTYNLRINTDSENYTISEAESAKMDDDLDTLRKAVAAFPLSDLKIEIIRQSRTDHFDVKTSLHLPGQTLTTSDWDTQLHPAYERCVKKLVGMVADYKERLGSKSEMGKMVEGTLHEVHPSQPPDLEAVQLAAAEGDYKAFRTALSVYEDAVQARSGRWIERYPEAVERLGDGLVMSDVVEEVFLLAFERFADRPARPMGEWLETLIDPAIQALVKNLPAEKENIEMVQTAMTRDK